MEQLKDLIRDNIRKMKAYQNAQSERYGPAQIKLDANENPYGRLNRYPDTAHSDLKSAVATLRAVDKKNVLITNGSDESIDLLFRMVCRPGIDKVLSFSPGFGIYKTTAELNDLEYISVPLDQDFDIDVEALKGLVKDDKIKMIVVCNPNNPTGKSFSSDRIEWILESFHGIVLLDEAYIDFADTQSGLSLLERYPRLIVIQTFSKAFSLAAARVGMCFAHPYLIETLDKMRMPYNVSSLNQEAAISALKDVSKINKRIIEIRRERSAMFEALSDLSCVEKVFLSDANFLLVRFRDASSVYELLARNSISVRNKDSEIRNCLRVSIGSPDENRRLIQILKDFR